MLSWDIGQVMHRQNGVSRRSKPRNPTTGALGKDVAEGRKNTKKGNKKENLDHEWHMRENYGSDASGKARLKKSDQLGIRNWLPWASRNLNLRIVEAVS